MSGVSENVLRGKTAIITGAAQGLGEAIARAYAEHGMRLALIDVKADLLNETAARLRAAHGVDVFTHADDLSDAKATQAAGRWAVETAGTPHILVHNAAILINRPLLDVTWEAWQRETNVIMGAAFLLTQAVWPAMVAAGGGHLLYVSSRSGIEGFLDESPYVAGKHALEGFMKCMAMEGEPHGISANTITPGMLMHTPMSEYNYNEEAKQKWVDPYLLTPGFVWVASQAPGAVSGQRLNAWELSTAQKA